MHFRHESGKIPVESARHLSAMDRSLLEKERKRYPRKLDNDVNANYNAEELREIQRKCLLTCCLALSTLIIQIMTKTQSTNKIIQLK